VCGQTGNQPVLVSIKRFRAEVTKELIVSSVTLFKSCKDGGGDWSEINRTWKTWGAARRNRDCSGTCETDPRTILGARATRVQNFAVSQKTLACSFLLQLSSCGEILVGRIRSFRAPLPFESLDWSALVVLKMSSLKFTPVASIPSIVEGVRSVYKTGRSRDLKWREAQLQGIKRLCLENKDKITAALQADLRRPKLECVLAEAFTVIAEADEAIAHLGTWAKKEDVTTPAILLPGHSYVIREPVGVVLIIGAWNFPIQLLLNPLVSAVAAGNVAVLKPSEISPASALLIEELLPRYVDPEAFRFVQGAVTETTELLKQQFDHICYTGNGMVATHVMAAASKHLTPVTLELGGKSPVIVDKDANLQLAASRIVVVSPRLKSRPRGLLVANSP
jgi:Aldehyde dehydrogenase family